MAQERGAQVREVTQTRGLPVQRGVAQSPRRVSCAFWPAFSPVFQSRPSAFSPIAFQLSWLGQVQEFEEGTYEAEARKKRHACLGHELWQCEGAYEPENCRCCCHAAAHADCARVTPLRMLQ